MGNERIDNWPQDDVDFKKRVKEKYFPADAKMPPERNDNSGYRAGSANMDYLRDLAHSTMDMDGALNDVSNINASQSNIAQNNLAQSMSGRGMAGSASAGGMAGALANKYSKDLASEWESTRRNKLNEMNQLGARLYQDRWNQMKREQQVKMAEWMFNHQKEMAAYLEAIKQGRPGMLEDLFNQMHSGIGDAITGLPIGFLINRLS